MEHVVCEKKEDVLYVKLSRPEKRNSFNQKLISELTEVFTTLVSKDTRALVLSGEGKSFCAGADLEYMKAQAQFSFKQNIKDAEKLFDMFQALYECEIPTIAQVHGHAMGGGLGLIGACDVVASESDTIFSFSEVKLGLVASVISPFVFRKLQSSHSRLWMLSARKFKAHQALNSGLVHFVGSVDETQEFVDSFLTDLKQASSEALRETKKLIIDLEETESFKTRCSELIAKCRTSKEAQRLMQQFLDRK